MYSGVPFMEVSTIVLHDMARAKPKSQSFTVPPEQIKMFCARHGGGSHYRHVAEHAGKTYDKRSRYMRVTTHVSSRRRLPRGTLSVMCCVKVS